MLEQGLALELDQDVNRVDARVDQVAQNEIDDPVPPAEGDRRFGALANIRLAGIAQMEGRPDEALTLIDRAVASEPRNSRRKFEPSASRWKISVCSSDN